ncbi:DMT family transporter [Herbaspirillum sp. LeCh32-8]|uniref:DMT family transporter n=1 Tax=Herbaspirillum sp. LeCh32-8 TaxID=2821356 RepID=UPI001AE92221|nr:DMT family transporter [Herbaspirillum sp. LeCh32-8]MBP0598571.1 DMT family transporter [Herbaspirillum sp. LeCh32-8]
MTPRATGLCFSLSAIFIFAMQDGISRHLGGAYPPVFIAMIRFWAFAGFALVLASRSSVGLGATAAAKRRGLQIARGVLLAVQIVVSIFSFSKVGLATTHSLYAGTPLIVACLSMPFLGEKVGRARWIATGIGFVGILLIVNPLHASFDAKIALPLFGMMLFAAYSVMTRLASRTDTAGTAFLYTGVAGAVAISVVGPFYWTHLTPGDWFWMLVLCVSSTCGHYLLIRSLEYLDAVVVQPMYYIQTVLVCLIGVFVFDEVLTPNMIAGCAVVICAGIFIIWREAMAGRARAALEA